MYAGLAAARQLDSFGYRVVIVEGHDRPGGRVYTKQLKVRHMPLGCILCLTMLQKRAQLYCHGLSCTVMGTLAVAVLPTSQCHLLLSVLHIVNVAWVAFLKGCAHS